MESRVDDNNLSIVIKIELDDFKDICRTCMSQNVNMNNLFNDTGNICERIKFCTGLQLVMEDDLPSLICSACMESLTVAYNFKIKCIQTDIQLHQEAKTNIVQPSGVFLREHHLNCGDHKTTVNVDKGSFKDCGGKDFSDVDKFKSDEEVKLRNTVKDERIKVEIDFMKDLSSRNKNNETIQGQIICKSKARKRSALRLYCKECNLRFRTKLELKGHRKAEHKIPQWVCKLCGEISQKKSIHNCILDSKGYDETRNEKSLFKVHNRVGVKRGPYRKRNAANANGLEADPGDQMADGKKKLKKKYKLNRQFCEKCDVKFASEEEFIRHKRDVHNYYYLCEICGRVLYNRDARFSHMVMHERPRFSCDHCDYSTTRKHDLVKHIYVHNGIKRYQCEYCPLSFHTTSNLRNHLRRHRDGAQVCTVCHKTFLDRYSYKRHLDSHKDSAPKPQFPCKLCGTCFRRRTRLNQHMLKKHSIHTPPRRPGRRRNESAGL